MTDKREISTKELILDTAERLFAERGFDGVSLRSIIAEAGVNLAAVHYHFHSREALLHALFARRLEPLNRKRLALLEALESEAAGRPLPVELILEAMLIPILKLVRDPARNGPTFARLIGRLQAEGGTELAEIFKKHMDEVVERFTQALRKALPGLPPAELFWRMHFAMGAMGHTLRGTRLTAVLSGGVFDPSDLEGGIDRLIAFLAAGLRAPLDIRNTHPSAQELKNARS